MLFHGGSEVSSTREVTATKCSILCFKNRRLMTPRYYMCSSGISGLRDKLRRYVADERDVLVTT
ncbi:hypothetical protein T02_9204 [Trichinella nativa]|uniref:Uncharacterized protein n=1 Tax=Trichinella nativa TaxID=6335 RepID=A0A0V1KIC6_9BILA|nr:hypothetical protein T02_9204 [Trichinella nativa]